MKLNAGIYLLLLTLSLRVTAATNKDAEVAATNPPPAKSQAPKIPDATHQPVCTTNTVSIAGKPVRYVAETGMLPLLKADGTTRASIFYIAYTREVPTNAAARPVMFCFNGGPGSSSVWLHLGALGPRRVKVKDDGTLPPPPFGLVDNEYSLLHQCDLVFIDPIATGFSRVTKDEKAQDFFGQTGDLESLGEFIRLWTTRHERWLAAKYLCGESYGVFRAAGLAEHLRSRYGMYLNGLVFVSGVLDFATIRGGDNDLPNVLTLPAYTAMAHYHKKLPPKLQANRDQAVAEAREFARTEYLVALHQGAALAAAGREKIAAKLASFTGLPAALILDNDLRIDGGTFRKKLLATEGLILGGYDARITGRDGNPAASGPEFDPSYAAAYGPFSATMNSYVRSELKFEADLPYEIIAGVQPWNYGQRNAYPSVTGALAAAMNQNPYLRVLVMGGRADLVCPVDSMSYSMEHLSLAPAYRKNISYAEFDAGHMMYVNQPDLKKFQQVVEQFVQP